MYIHTPSYDAHSVWLYIYIHGYDTRMHVQIKGVIVINRGRGKKKWRMRTVNRETFIKRVKKGGMITATGKC